MATLNVDSIVNSAGSGGPSFTNGITGVATNSAASSGTIGEMFTASQSTATNAAASGSFLTLCSFSLTAGEWFIYGSAHWDRNGATGVSTIYPKIETTAGLWHGVTTDPNAFVNQDIVTATTAHLDAITSWTFPISGGIIRLSSTQTYELKVRVNYSTGTPQWRGYIEARRMR